MQFADAPHRQPDGVYAFPLSELRHFISLGNQMEYPVFVWAATIN